MTEFEIRVNLRRRGTQDIYELETEGGILDASVDDWRRYLGIANIAVEKEFRRQGRGTALVRRALEIATDLEVGYVYSALLSREAIDTMRSVFGDESLDIKCEGTYTQDGESDRYDANATLWYPLQR